MFGKNNPNSFQNRLRVQRMVYVKEDGGVGLTQKELATRMSVDITSIRHWEKGRHRPLRVNRAVLKTLFPTL